MGQADGEKAAAAADLQPATPKSDSLLGHHVTRVARQIAQQAGARLVHEAHDLWRLSTVELSDMTPGPPFAMICQSAEDADYRRSGSVVSVGPKVNDPMASGGLDLKKLSIVPNGISPQDWWASSQPLRQDVEQAMAPPAVWEAAAA